MEYLYAGLGVLSGVCTFVVRKNKIENISVHSFMKEYQ
jgi:hypothetical protein